MSNGIFFWCTYGFNIIPRSVINYLLNFFSHFWVVFRTDMYTIHNWPWKVNRLPQLTLFADPVFADTKFQSEDRSFPNNLEMESEGFCLSSSKHIYCLFNITFLNVTHFDGNSKSVARFFFSFFQLLGWHRPAYGRPQPSSSCHLKF